METPDLRDNKTLALSTSSVVSLTCAFPSSAKMLGNRCPYILFLDDARAEESKQEIDLLCRWSTCWLQAHRCNIFANLRLHGNFSAVELLSSEVRFAVDDQDLTDF